MTLVIRNATVVERGGTGSPRNLIIENGGIRAVTDPGAESRWQSAPDGRGEAFDGTDLIADGVHVHPAMVNLAWKCKRARLALVTDAVSAPEMPTSKYSFGEHEVIVDDTSVRLMDGTLAGGKVTPEMSIRNLAAWAGCTLAEATRARSGVPAELLGLRNKGQLTSGADADLTLPTPEGRVAATIVGGELLWMSGATNQMSKVQQKNWVTSGANRR